MHGAKQVERTGPCPQGLTLLKTKGKTEAEINWGRICYCWSYLSQVAASAHMEGKSHSHQESL